MVFTSQVSIKSYILAPPFLATQFSSHAIEIAQFLLLQILETIRPLQQALVSPKAY